MKTDAAFPSLSREIASTLPCVEAACREIRAWLEDKHLGDMAFTVELVARECLNNAVLHGNGGDAGKKAGLILVLSDKWVRLQVSDEGRGFDWRQALHTPVPSEHDVNGRGLAIARLRANHIRFTPPGNKITLWFLTQKTT